MLPSLFVSSRYLRVVEFLSLGSYLVKELKQLNCSFLSISTPIIPRSGLVELLLYLRMDLQKAVCESRHHFHLLTSITELSYSSKVIVLLSRLCGGSPASRATCLIYGCFGCTFAAKSDSRLQY